MSKIKDFQVGNDNVPIKLKKEQVVDMPELEKTILLNKAKSEQIQEDLNFHENVLYGSEIIYKDEIIDTYDVRQTAQGKNVVDGSKAVLKKVEGNTTNLNNLNKNKNLFNLLAINGYEQQQNQSIVQWASASEMKFLLNTNVASIDPLTGEKVTRYYSCNIPFLKICPFTHPGSKLIFGRRFSQTNVNQTILGGKITLAWKDAQGSVHEETLIEAGTGIKVNTREEATEITFENIKGYLRFYADAPADNKKSTEHTYSKIMVLDIVDDINESINFPALNLYDYSWEPFTDYFYHTNFKSFVATQTLVNICKPFILRTPNVLPTQKNKSMVGAGNCFEWTGNYLFNRFAGNGYVNNENDIEVEETSAIWKVYTSSYGIVWDVPVLGGRQYHISIDKIDWADEVNKYGNSLLNICDSQKRKMMINISFYNSQGQYIGYQGIGLDKEGANLHIKQNITTPIDTAYLILGVMFGTWEYAANNTGVSDYEQYTFNTSRVRIDNPKVALIPNGMDTSEIIITDYDADLLLPNQNEIELPAYDYIDLEQKKIYKNGGTLSLTGDEGWSQNSTFGNDFGLYHCSLSKKADENKEENLYCNYILNTSEWTGNFGPTTNLNSVCGLTQDVLLIQLKASQNINQFTDYLKYRKDIGVPIVVRYPWKEKVLQEEINLLELTSEQDTELIETVLQGINSVPPTLTQEYLCISNKEN